MKFGKRQLAEALGGVLAHTLRLEGGVLRKGSVLGPAELRRLAQAGMDAVTVAQLEPDDVAEDAAATRIAAALGGADIDVGAGTTGRVNLHARRAGLLRLDAARVQAANRVHEGLTIATLLPDTPVEDGQMLATVKVIPYAVPGQALADVLAALGTGSMQLSPWTGIRAGLVMTCLPETSNAVMAKMRGAVLGRLGPLGGLLVAEETVMHDEAAVAAALQGMLAADEPPQLLLVSGVAATVDRGDVIPAAVLAAGGRVVHAGMPVDPGNLLVLAELDGPDGVCPVISIPTCARSPKLNGFDFVLRRFAAGATVTREDIMAMGVGGLLTEIENRPMPRDNRRYGAA